jgi:hypothetical protein
MQYLMVLLLIVAVVLLMLAAVLGISYGFGAWLNSRGATHEADPCAQCQADRDWYEELPVWQRSLVTAWWLANRYHCAAKGCG